MIPKTTQNRPPDIPADCPRVVSTGVSHGGVPQGLPRGVPRGASRGKIHRFGLSSNLHYTCNCWHQPPSRLQHVSNRINPASPPPFGSYIIFKKKWELSRGSPGRPRGETIQTRGKSSFHPPELRIRPRSFPVMPVADQISEVSSEKLNDQLLMISDLP